MVHPSQLSDRVVRAFAGDAGAPARSEPFPPVSPPGLVAAFGFLLPRVVRHLSGISNGWRAGGTFPGRPSLRVLSTGPGTGTARTTFRFPFRIG